MIRDIIFKFLFKVGVASILRNSKSEYITVLNLHRITEERDEFYNPILPHKFYKIIEYCCKYYEIISFEFIESPTLKPKLILSFDDGYYDFIEYALPHLKKLGLPSNHNIVNSCVNNNTPIWTHRFNEIIKSLKRENLIDEVVKEISQGETKWDKIYFSVFNYLLELSKTERDIILELWSNRYDIKLKSNMMNWEDIIYCSKNCVEIGSHTYFHSSLKNVVSEIELEKEIFDSLKEISHYLKRETHILALPNGQYNDTVLKYASNCNIKYLLFADDQLNCISKVSKFHNNISRIGLSDVSLHESLLKIEFLHGRLKSIL
jgi:peptidoglycan/xylan/chitin deacetylase (PgdA/CDA1 family)